jgi:hypothetical protein
MTRPVGSNQVLATATLEATPALLVVDPDPASGLVVIALGGWPRAKLELGVDQALELSLALVGAVNHLGIRRMPMSAVCAVCGERFRAKQRDARLCSAGCRQRRPDVKVAGDPAGGRMNGA